MDIWRALLKMKAPGDRQPDFERFRRSLLGNEPGPVTVGDIFADFETVSHLLQEPVLDYISLAEDPDQKITMKDLWWGYKFVGQTIRFCCLAGWDYCWSYSIIPFKGFAFQVTDNTSSEVKDGKRGWLNDNRGPIMSWDDFKRFRWPRDIKAVNAMSRTMAKRVPDGMKVMVIPGGVFEWTTWLMGLVPFSYALADQPDLVDAVIEKVTSLIAAVVEDIMTEPNVGGIFMGDDLGFYSGTFVSPRVLREKFLPRTRQIVDITHKAGGVFVLHTCGNMYAVMDDIIAMGVDAKHSYEDKIMPVEEVHAKWGDRIGIIGGVDMNLMAKGSEDEVRARTRQVLDLCATKGRYVLGTGNSVANYVPLGNYLAMIDEGHKWNREHFGRDY
ncbi:MAG TPA: uroporphyrinogen decarboxylase family protein [bacterium]|nr:uroporphyrinogen decarboxylase family protein [bacterium]